MSLTSKIAQLLLSLFTVSRTVVLFISGLIFIHLFLFTIFIVDGISMEPTLHTNEVLLVDRVSYEFGQPQRGDIVVVRYPGDPRNVKYVKRIIGIPGDRIEIKNGNVFIYRPDFLAGKQLVEFYLSSEIKTEPPQIHDVGSNEYFTMGDNRLVSLDSRYFGTVPQKDIIGKAIIILFPFNHFNLIPHSFFELKSLS